MADPTYPSPRFTVSRRIEREDGLDEVEMRLSDETAGILSQLLTTTGSLCAMSARVILPPEMMPMLRGQTVGFTIIPTDPA